MNWVGRAVTSKIGSLWGVEGDLDPVIASPVCVALLKGSLGQGTLQFGAVVAHGMIVALVWGMSVVVFVDGTVGQAFIVLYGGPLRVDSEAVEKHLGRLPVGWGLLAGADVGIDREGRCRLWNLLHSLLLQISIKYRVLVLRVLQPDGIFFACRCGSLAAREATAAC